MEIIIIFSLYFLQNLIWNNSVIKNMYVLNDKNCISQITIHCVVFGHEDYKLKVLISKLKFKGEFYALHSDFIKQNEDID